MTDRTALLLTGLQNDYFGSQGALARSGVVVSHLASILPALTLLVQTARASGVPILHLREQVLPFGLSDSPSWRLQREREGAMASSATASEWGSAFLDGFSPLEGEFEIERFRPSGLQNTRAEVLLRSERIRRLIVAGVESHRSVIATATQAVCLDFSVVVPIDCIASSDNNLHQAAVSVLGTWCEMPRLMDVVAEVSRTAEAANRSQH